MTKSTKTPEVAATDPELVSVIMTPVDTGIPPVADAPEAIPAAKKVTIGSAVTDLLMDATLSYDAIVDIIHAQFKGANTSARSIASVAARLRKTGIAVPSRRKAKPTIA